MKIMLVEDERIIALQFGWALSKAGWQVVVAHSGESALRTVEEHRPDLLLMDILLDGEMDGIETAVRIRDRHPIPIIFVTASSDPLTKNRAEAFGHHGFLRKPVDMDTLLATVRTFLPQPEPQSEALAN